MLAVLVFLLTLILFKGSRYPNLRDAYPLTGLAPDGHSQQQGSEASDGQILGSWKGRPKYKTTAKPEKVVVPPWQNVKAFNGSDGPIKSFKKLAFEDQENFVKDLTTWSTLEIDNHWPSWDAYDDLDYDPNRWEGFDWCVLTLL